jgi:fatty acid desaturase
MSAAKTGARAVQRHRFSKEILSAVKSCSRLDNWHGPLEVVEHWSVIGLCIWTSSWGWQHLDAALALPLYLVAIFHIGGRQRALAGVLHQACHGTLMSNKPVARVIGALFGGYPVLQSYTGYRSSHVWEHHGQLGDPDRDPDYLQYRRYGLCGEGCVRETLRRHLLTIVGPRSTLSYIDYLLRHRIWNRGERPWEAGLRIALYAGTIGTALSFGWLSALVAYWFLPLITTQVWIGAISELLEHYPLIESAPRIDIYVSWNRRSGPIERFLLGEKKGEGYHLVHHLFPQVPLWRLDEVDRVLSRDPVYASLEHLGGVLRALASIFAALPARRVSPERT